MKRHLGDENFEKFLKDFDFLFKIIRNSKGELDLRLRGKCFNLYYQGNSLAKVSFKGTNYEISIHKKFIEQGKIFCDDDRFQMTNDGKSSYSSILLYSTLLRPFFQQKYLSALCRKIREVNYSEELKFEQMLITDNFDREDFFILDRQVTEPNFRGRVDLLALKQKNDNQYHFVVIEIKLGKNPELKKEALEQLNYYIDHIQKNINDWKKCYKMYYSQIKQTGIFKLPSFKSIEILDEIKGAILVCGYSGLARENIENLNTIYPNTKVIQLKYEMKI